METMSLHLFVLIYLAGITIKLWQRSEKPSAKAPANKKTFMYQKKCSRKCFPSTRKRNVCFRSKIWLLESKKVPELLQIHFGSPANVFGLRAVRNISEKKCSRDNVSWFARAGRFNGLHWHDAIILDMESALIR